MKNIDDIRLECGHYKCHYVTVTYLCNIGCGAKHITGWCEMCELSNNHKMPSNFKLEIGKRKHLNNKKPKWYDRKKVLFYEMWKVFL